LLLWVDIISRTAGNAWALPWDASAVTMPVQVRLGLLLAASLRLGVLPLRLPFSQEPSLRRGLGASLRLVPTAACLVVYVRVAYVGLSGSWVPYLLALTGLSALVAAFRWFSASDELSGRGFWILALAALGLASAIARLPQAALAWSLACLLSGGLLFAFSPRHRYSLPLPLFSLLGFSGLPFTPAWAGMELVASQALHDALPLFTRVVIILLPMLWIGAHALLLAGYIRHAIRSAPLPSRPQRWVWLIYPLGLALFPIIQFAWLWQSARWAAHGSLTLGLTGTANLSPVFWVAGGAALVLAALLLWISIRFQPHLPRRWIDLGRSLFSLQWAYQFIETAFRLSTRLVNLVNGLLEGDGGILWVLLWLALVLALLLQGVRL
jgi:hypothetical protein